MYFNGQGHDPTVMDGRFIVFEGIDGSGKTGLCGRVHEALLAEGVPAVVTREPTHEGIGAFIRADSVDGITPAAEALLFTADRAMHTLRINGLLAEGRTVLCDRYFASTAAYQSAAMGGDAEDVGWLLEMNRPVIRMPDITFLLDIDAGKGMQRVNGRGAADRYEEEAYQQAVRRAYLDLAERFGFIIIDADRGRDEVLAEVMRHIREVV
jgi:dTMP kinase